MGKPVVIITNVAAPIGRACAREFAGGGWRLILSDPNETAGREVAESVSDKAPGVGFVSGLNSNRLHVHNVIAEAMETFGRIDAAILAPPVIARDEEAPTAFHQLAEDDLKPATLYRLWGATLFSQAIIRQFIKQADAATSEWAGAIVNIGFGDEGGSLRPASAAADAGVYALTRSLATAYAPERMRINAIRASGVSAGQLTPQEAIALREVSPGGRLVEVDAVAHLAAFLAGDAAAGISGQVIDVDGGGVFGMSTVIRKLTKKRS